MSAVFAPADRRFRRAHVKPGRRRHSWRAVLGLWRYGLFALVVAYGLYRGWSVAAHPHVLQIDRIVVRGNERLSEGDVLALLSGLRGESVIWTDLDRWRSRLLASAWVRDAALRWSLPSTVEVLIWERQPAMLGRVHGDMYLVDDRGVIIDQLRPQYADVDLPIVDGLRVARTDTGWLADDVRAALATRVIVALNARADIAKRLSQIDVSDVHNASVILSGDPAVIELGEDQFLQRMQSYVDVASALREHVPAIDVVDARFDDRIYVRPVGRGRETGEVAAGPTRQARQRRDEPVRHGPRRAGTRDERTR